MKITKTLFVPTKEGLKEVTGRTMNLKVGDKKHKCFIHPALGTVNQMVLADYRSGQIITKIRGSYDEQVTDYSRNRAQKCLDILIAKCGEKRFFSTVFAAPKIN